MKVNKISPYYQDQSINTWSKGQKAKAIPQSSGHLAGPLSSLLQAQLLGLGNWADLNGHRAVYIMLEKFSSSVIGI